MDSIAANKSSNIKHSVSLAATTSGNIASSKHIQSEHGAFGVGEEIALLLGLTGPFHQPRAESSSKIVPMPRFLQNRASLLSPNKSR